MNWVLKTETKPSDKLEMMDVQLLHYEVYHEHAKLTRFT
jgi:hypothetical protein